jgi:hypothetical protein
LRVFDAMGKFVKEKEDEKMCKSKCEHPEKMKGKPGECTPEQIKECHGESKSHPCEEEKKRTPSEKKKRKHKS